MSDYITGIDHIGVAVPDIDTALELYLRLGYRVITPSTLDEYRSINVCFVENAGTLIELVSPAYKDKPSPVDGFINSKKGYEIYHICYKTSDIEKQLDKMKAEGYMELQKLAPAVAMDNRRVVYLYNRKMGLVELAEE